MPAHLIPPATAGPPALAVHRVGVRYGPVVAVSDVSFAVAPGELVAVVGPNGAGKSSLFRAITGLARHQGEVLVAGEVCHHRRRLNVAFIPQRSDVNLAFPILVHEVVMLGRRRFLRLGQRPRTLDRHAVADSLDRVGLADLRDRPLGALSGGQVQRAFLARALAQEADVLLLDESLSGVDRPSTESLLTLFERLARTGVSLLVATHDLALARRRFRRCLAINCCLVADGDPACCLDPDCLDRVYGTAPVAAREAFA